jgi:hypothetical protein
LVRSCCPYVGRLVLGRRSRGKVASRRESPTWNKTEYEFVLPRGYVDAEGNVHREGVMRLANAKDEIAR